ncbi:STAS domain-containing protein [Micromonospora sp. MP36]|nr:STAS domain-containing protein [Micromonospora sp. MP36]
MCHCGCVDQGGAPPVFSATTEVDGDRVRVVVTGEVDMATADTMYRTALREPVAHLTLDLRAVTFFDSAAIHALVRLAQRFAGTLTVLPSRQVRRVLEISGLGDQGWLAPA